MIFSFCQFQNQALHCLIALEPPVDLALDRGGGELHDDVGLALTGAIDAFVRLQIKFGAIRRRVPDDACRLGQREPVAHGAGIGDEHMRVFAFLKVAENDGAIFCRDSSGDDCTGVVLVQLGVQQCHHRCERSEDDDLAA
jgi:hypothetical protein